MRRTVRRLPVRGADLVLMAMHARWKRAGQSNNTVMVVHCDGPLPADRIRRAVDSFLDDCPWPASRLRRPFPWGKLHWAAGARAALVPPPVRAATVASAADLQRLVEDEINTAIDPKRESPLRMVAVERVANGGPAQGVLVVTWFHPLMDPRGGQNFLAELSARDAGGADARRDNGYVATAPDARPFRERGRIARASLAYMRTLAPVAPVSPGAGLSGPGRVRYRQRTFVERDAAARQTREISWRLAVVGRAMAELWRRRGLPDVPFLLPISVDLRPKGEAGATFGNLLAFHFARFTPSETGDVAALARALRRQMADAVRDGQIDANAVAMEFLHYRPLRTMLRALPWTTGGEIFSFNCADLADFAPTRTECFGRDVVNAYHVPAVLPRPGIGVFFNRCAARQNVVISWVDGAVSEEDANRIVEVVAEGMGWASAS